MSLAEQNSQRSSASGAAKHNTTAESVIGSIQRPPKIVDDGFDGNIEMPRYQPVLDFDAGPILQFRRGLVWTRAILAFFGGTLRDIITPGREDNNQRRARRLANIIRDVGGTAIKLGQQVGMRIDFLPYEYYTELSQLFDDVPPFPFEEAIEHIENASGKPLAQTYRRIDPNPIGSGSIACVYQAILHDGTRVAVKVRRPKVGHIVEADFDVIKFFFIILRFLNVLPPIITFESLDELHDAIIEEMDFRWEARHTNIFRVEAEKAHRQYFSAPYVYFEYSNSEVLVQEFVQGVSLKDIMTMVERDDQQGLALLARYNIHPQEVARRLLWSNYWSIWRMLFFHADPHPSNVIVLTNSQLVFIDFGAVGSLGDKLRWSLQEVYEAEARGDIEGAARTAITLMEPLPPLDTNMLINDVKLEFQRASVSWRSEGVPWQERTTAQLWFGFFRVARKYNVPLPSTVVRLVRGTLLYDTLAARIHPEINLTEVYDQYRTDAGIQARRRLTRAIRTRIKNGPDPEDYLALEQILRESTTLIFQGQRLLNTISYQIQPFAGQVILVAGVIIQTTLRLILVWGTPLAVAAIIRVLTLSRDPNIERDPYTGGVSIFANRDLIWQSVVENVLNSNVYWTIATILTVIILITATRRLFGGAFSYDKD